MLLMRSTQEIKYPVLLIFSVLWGIHFFEEVASSAANAIDTEQSHGDVIINHVKDVLAVDGAMDSNLKNFSRHNDWNQGITQLGMPVSLKYVSLSDQRT